MYPWLPCIMPEQTTTIALPGSLWVQNIVPYTHYVHQLLLWPEKSQGLLWLAIGSAVSPHSRKHGILHLD